MKTMRLLMVGPLMMAAILVASSAQKTQSASSPDAVIRELYRVHNNGKGGVFEAKGKKYIYKYFDQKLADLIWKDISETPEGEVGNLDFDPLYNAQDTQVTNFLVGKPVTNGDEASALVTFRNFGKKSSITFNMHHSSAGWQISNLVYGDKSDLVNMLSPHQ